MSSLRLSLGGLVVGGLMVGGLVGGLLLIGGVVSDASALQATPPSDARVIAGVYVHEKAGRLSEAEERLLRGLDARMIPLPDTVRIRRDSLHFGVYSVLGGEIVLLSADRFRTPDALSRRAPYLFGRSAATVSAAATARPRYTHTLAHEIGHYLSTRLPGRTPRPAWGTARGLEDGRRAQELEAELIAAVLQEVVFGLRPSDLGYPSTVAVQGDGQHNTQALMREYRGIMADAWRLRTLGIGSS
jgi:hypothetical protein